MEFTTVILIIIGLIGLLFLLFAVVLYIRESSSHEFSSTSSVSIRKINSADDNRTDAVTHQRVADRMDADADMPSTRKLSQSDIPGARKQDDSETQVPVNPMAAAADLEKKGDLSGAAEIYRKTGRIQDELRIRSQQTPSPRLADLYLVSGKLNEQTTTLRALLQKNPGDLSIRLRLIKANLLENKIDEAKDLLSTAIDERESLGLTPEFFLAASRFFQSTLSYKDAMRAAQTASDMIPNNQKYACMVQYLNEVMRLMTLSEDTSSHLKKNEALKATLDTRELDALDSSADMDLSDFDSDPDMASAEMNRSKPVEHRVIVGHFAQGYFRDTLHQNDDIYKVTPVDQIVFENILAHRDTSSLFQVRDKLIDSPAVLRLNRLFIREQQQGLLRERFAAISRFSHPNISRIIYIDRIGSVIRIVSEYHQGGSLQSMVAQLKHIGIPFIIRMLLQISNGLVECHQAGIIHGDLRMENIMVGHDQLMKLNDFAIQPWPVHHHTNQSGIPKEEAMIDFLKFGELCDQLLSHTINPDNQSDVSDEATGARDLVGKISEKIRAGNVESMAGIQSDLLKAMSLISG